MKKMSGTGLPNVFLIDGVVEHSDGAVSYRDLDGLYVALAGAIAARVTSLTAGELRFLRKRLKMTQDDVGRLGGKTGQVAAMWEKGTRPVPVAEGNMLRLAWMARYSKRGLVAAVLAMEAGDGPEEPRAYVLRYVDGAGWHEAVEDAQAFARAEADAHTKKAIAQAMSGPAVENHYTMDSLVAIETASTVAATDTTAASQKLFT